MSILFFILILVALILVHELGHFSVAKLFGIRVDEFGIGFPPRLLKVKFGETIYSLNLLFFGGFVRIFGENNEEGKEHPRSFAHKPKTVQSAVIVAGIVFNILFAWLAVSAGYMVGLPTSAQHSSYGTVEHLHTTIVGIIPASPAEKVGLQAGDIVEGIETATARTAHDTSANDTRTFIAAHQDESMVITVSRKEEMKNVVVRAADGLIEGRKAVGIQLDDIGILKLPPHLALLEGATLTYDLTVSTAKGLMMFFAQIARGVADFSSVAGPIGITTIGAHAVQDGFASAIMITALISINLAIINLLPIPGLDGGRFFLIVLEAIRRKPLSPRLTLGATIAGFVFLIGLMVIVSFHDVVRLIG